MEHFRELKDGIDRNVKVPIDKVTEIIAKGKQQEATLAQTEDSPAKDLTNDERQLAAHENRLDASEMTSPTNPSDSADSKSSGNEASACTESADELGTWDVVRRGTVVVLHNFEKSSDDASGNNQLDRYNNRNRMARAIEPTFGGASGNNQLGRHNNRNRMARAIGPTSSKGGVSSDDTESRARNGDSSIVDSLGGSVVIDQSTRKLMVPNVARHLLHEIASYNLAQTPLLTASIVAILMFELTGSYEVFRILPLLVIMKIFTLLLSFLGFVVQGLKTESVTEIIASLRRTIHKKQESLFVEGGVDTIAVVGAYKAAKMVKKRRRKVDRTFH